MVVYELGQLGFSPELFHHVLVPHVEVLELLDRHRRASPRTLKEYKQRLSYNNNNNREDGLRPCGETL
jgi:hypothetical protein